jgi:mono/diheme cytochrome c family protein
MKDKLIWIVMLLFITVIITGCGGAAEPTEVPTPTVHPGKSVMNSKCGTCHDITRVTSHQDDLEGWELTVDRMIMLGTQLSDQQRADLIDYLSQEYPAE